MSDLTSIIQSLNTSAAKASQYTELLKQVAAGDKDTVVDIDGELIPTLSRIADLTLQALNDLQYQVLGDYAGGIEITNFGQVVLESGELYRLKADQTLPYTTTGTWVGDDENRFVSVGDGVLRADLAAAGGIKIIGNGAIQIDSLKGPDGLGGPTSLIDATWPVAGMKVRTLGYRTPGDGGGNDYEIGTGFGTDDGGSVIDLPGSGLQAKGLFVDGLVIVDQFGTHKNSVDNDTASLKAFFDYCIAESRKGHISEGSYLVDPGQLSFDNNHIEKPFPEISTDGFGSVSFNMNTNIDAPFISISNGTASSGSGKFWRGGGIGGITFNQNGKPTSANQHGISLRGIVGASFGHMRANDLGGSCILIPEFLFSATNPDPYNVSDCNFRGVEANRCKRFGIENKNWLGFTGNLIQYFRAIECEMGGWFGFGTANRIDHISMGSVAGWAFDDGTNVAATGGAPLRISIGAAEIDNPENGIRLNRTTIFDFEQLRIVHRYNFGPLNPSAGYWPRKAIEFAGGASSNTSFISGKIIHRVESGGAKVDMGVFCDLGNDPNVNDIHINSFIQDNAGFGFDDSELYSNINSSSFSLTLQSRGVDVVNVKRTSSSLYRGSAASTILRNGGFTTAANDLTFPTVSHDPGGHYDGTSFTVPVSGLYLYDIKIQLALAVGTRVQLGMIRDRGAVRTLISQKIIYSSNANAIHYQITGTAFLLQGDKLIVNGANNSGSDVAVSATISNEADNVMSINPVVTGL